MSLMLSNLPVLSAHVWRLDFITLRHAPTGSLRVRGKRRHDAGEEALVSGDERKHGTLCDVRFRGEPCHLFPKPVRAPFVSGIIQAKGHPVDEDLHFAGGRELFEYVPFVVAVIAYMGLVWQTVD